jgi:prolyl oligopeptidase
MRRTLLASLALAACSQSPRPTPATPVTAPPPDVAVVAEADAGPRPDDLEAWNRLARAGSVTETLHGTEVADPYRSLEEDTPATREWIDRQTARSERFLTARARPGMADRLSRLSDIGSLSAATVVSGKVFYRRRDPGREQPALMITDVPSSFVRTPNATARVLIDPTRYGERAAMDWYVPSPRGRYVAFGISQNGDERTTLRVLDVQTGEVRQESIEHTKWCRLSWLPDETGFYYTRYPKEGEPGFDAERPDTYWRRLYVHRFTARPDGADDPLVFQGGDRTEAPSPSVSPDGRWLVINHFVGWSRYDVYLIDRNAPVAAGQRPRAMAVAVGHESLNTGSVYRGRLYLTTNRDAPKYRVLAAPVAALVAADARVRNSTPGTGVTPLALAPAGPWRTVIAEGQHPLEETTFAGNRIVGLYLENIVSKLRVFDLNGAPQGEVALPTEGSVLGIGSQDDQPHVALVFTSFFLPASVHTIDTRTPQGATTPVLIDAPLMDVDTSRFQLSRGTARSADGTDINVFYMHRRDIPRDGTNPVFLTGYGGFNIALTPRFNPRALYWLERGGVYAVANLRGGSEFGEAWHRAGSRENKHHVFEDFEASIRWLASSGISAPERIAIQGGSNGGLLMGAMITRCPDAFRAAVADVGLYDMVRFHRFPPAEIWTTEYGTPENATDFRYLYEYSPYHQIRAGQRYPAVWVSTADHDTRVFWGHSTKFAARLQESQSGFAPIYFYMERNVGHGAGMQRSDQVRSWVRMFTFVEDRLGLPAAQ